MDVWRVIYVCMYVCMYGKRVSVSCEDDVWRVYVCVCVCMGIRKGKREGESGLVFVLPPLKTLSAMAYFFFIYILSENVFQASSG